MTVAVGGTGIATGIEIADGTVPGIGRPGAGIQTGTVYLQTSFFNRYDEFYVWFIVRMIPPTTPLWSGVWPNT